jgi:CRP-like cAMP-binding protein
MVVDEKTDFRQIARAGGSVLSYRAGDFIVREGDTAAFMYIVLTGSVEMSTRDKVVVTIPEGKPFGMLSLIDHRQRANTRGRRRIASSRFSTRGPSASWSRTRRNSSGT